MKQKPIAEIYHQETKYYENEMGKHQQQLNWSAQPSPFKAYHSEKKIDLVPYLPLRNNPFTEDPIEPILEDEGYPFGIGAISRLLYFTNGVTGILQYPSGQSLSLRAAPTAGGLYPTEIYCATQGLSSLDDGIYNFQVKDHSLVPVWEGNFWTEFKKYCLEHPAIEESNLLIILTAVYARSTWRYHERAYRRILLDTGHILGNLSAYAPEEGFMPSPIGGFVDRSLNRLLFLDESSEGVLFVVALPRHPVNSALPGEASRFLNTKQQWNTQATLPDEEDEANNPLLLHLHHSSSIAPEEVSKEIAEENPKQTESLIAPYTMKPEIPTLGEAIDWGRSIGATIVHRRSTRAFSGGAVPKLALDSLLEYAYADTEPKGIPVADPTLLETYIIVQQVVGLEEGVYFFSPEDKAFRTIYSGDFRNQSWHFCLGQELARDAAFIVVHTAHLGKAIARYGNRAYRYMHLNAGYIGQRMNLAAIRLGLGVSGIGGFYDDEVNALLGLSLDKIIVYITTLGQPHEKA